MGGIVERKKRDPKNGSERAREREEEEGRSLIRIPCAGRGPREKSTGAGSSPADFEEPHSVAHVNFFFSGETARSSASSSSVYISACLREREDASGFKVGQWNTDASRTRLIGPCCRPKYSRVRTRTLNNRKGLTLVVSFPRYSCPFFYYEHRPCAYFSLLILIDSTLRGH